MKRGMNHRREATSAAPIRGPYRTGDETRRKLIDVALRLFSRNGFAATSTREICAAAGVKIPAIPYHFGSKEGLYLACADHVVDRYRARMGDRLAAIQHVLPGLSPDEARAALRETLRLLIAVAREADAAEPWLAFMLQEMTRPGAAHERLQAQLWAPGLAFVAALIGRSRNPRAPDTAADRVDALLLLSSLSSITTARQVTVAFAGWREIDEAGAALIAARLDRWIDQL